MLKEKHNNTDMEGGDKFLVIFIAILITELWACKIITVYEHKYVL